ncbi:MAG: sensor histidine kinase [Phycisphaerae bacterium]|nr:sensor histidine kinase [Tepidisphaeraceae bacterium]
MRILLLLTLTFVCAAAVAAPAPPLTKREKRLRANPNAVITTVDGVTELSAEEAALRLPVKIKGVVTYLSPNPQVMFVQDETGGVCVVGARDRELRLVIKPGSIVEVEGITTPGKLVPHVTARQKDPLKIVVLGEGPLPAPRPVRFDDLLAGPELHGELVEVTGVVRSFRVEALASAGQLDALVVTLMSARGERLEAAMLNWHAATATLPTHLVGATVKLRGVFNSTLPERTPAAGMRLLFAGLKEIRIDAPATPAFDLSVASVASLRGLDADQPPLARARVQGVVTLPLGGKGMYVESTDGAVWVETPPGALKAGDRLDVVGFPSRRGSTVLLEDAVWRTDGRAPLPEPPLITAGQALEPAMDSRTVRMEALVLEVSRLSEGPTLVLQSGDRVFLARLVDAEGLPSLRAESWVRLTGVCLHSQSPMGTPAMPAGDRAARAEAPPALRGVGGGPAQPLSFHLLLGGPAAVDVIHAPSWWTFRRILLVCGALALVTAVAIAWVALLRLRVARQTATIRTHLARETLYEERVRIARELHDSLEQDLLGISMQLNATEKLLARPDRAKEALHLAAAMVRRSQAETHRAVWDLRDNRDAQEGLVPKLLDAVAGLRPGAAAQIDVHVTGDARPLPADVENHLLRLALEAVTNALKHAQASRIAVALDYADAAISLKIADDGRGFDPAQLPPMSSGHFGVFGMRERAEKLRGALTIDSAPGKGTTIALLVPTHHTAPVSVN